MTLSVCYLWIIKTYSLVTGLNNSLGSDLLSINLYYDFQNPVTESLRTGNKGYFWVLGLRVSC